MAMISAATAAASSLAVAAASAVTTVGNAWWSTCTSFALVAAVKERSCRGRVSSVTVAVSSATSSVVRVAWRGVRGYGRAANDVLDALDTDAKAWLIAALAFAYLAGPVTTLWLALTATRAWVLLVAQAPQAVTMAAVVFSLASTPREVIRRSVVVVWEGW